MALKPALILILLIAITLMPVTTASFIADYKVTDEIALGQQIKISGTYIEDLNNNQNIYCEHRIIDQNGYEVYRASDSTTNMLGHFSKVITTNEPTFKRGEDYNAQVICDYTTTSQQFTILQKEDLSHALLWEFKYFTDVGNLYPIAFLLILIILIIGVPYTIYRWVNNRGQR